MNNTVYLLVEWVNDQPILNGAKFSESKEELLSYYCTMPKVKGVEYTICEIHNIKNLPND